MTVKELKSEIRRLTQEANIRFFEAKEKNIVSPQLEAVKERLIRYGSKPSVTRRTETIGLGFRDKTKARLTRQYQELNRMLKYDIWSPKGIEQAEDEKQKAYESFKKYHPDWSKDKWTEFVEMLGNAKGEILNSFGYERSSTHSGSRTAKVKSEVSNESLADLYSRAYDNNVDLMSVMEYVYNKKTAGKGVGQEQALDLLNEELKNVINKRGMF